jgi:hypothetical protein
LRRWIAVAGGALALMTALACWAEESPGTVHPRGTVMEDTAVELMRALLREDAPASRKHFDRLSELVKRIEVDDRDQYPSEIVSLARAYHMTVDRGRGSSRAGEFESALNEFVWAQRTCVKCHTSARREGLLPESGPLWQAGD